VGLVAALCGVLGGTGRSHRLVIATGLNGTQLLNLREYNFWKSLKKAPANQV
jgi:hypothetical protein